MEVFDVNKLYSVACSGDRKICERKWPWPILRYYPDICLDGLKNTRRTSVKTVGFLAKIQIRDL